MCVGPLGDAHGAPNYRGMGLVLDPLIKLPLKNRDIYIYVLLMSNCPNSPTKCNSNPLWGEFGHLSNL